MKKVLSLPVEHASFDITLFHFNPSPRDIPLFLFQPATTHIKTTPQTLEPTPIHTIPA